MLYVYGGECRLCEVGRPTNIKTHFGDKLFTGDIVVIYTVSKEDELIEEVADGLTVVVDDSSDFAFDKEYIKERYPFIMGIKDCKPIQEGDLHYLKSDVYDTIWIAKKVKSYEDVIDKEHWKDFGFNYREET